MMTDPLTTLPQESFWSRSKKSFWAGLIVAAVITASVLAYVLYFRGVHQGNSYAGDIRVEIEAPSSSPSGSEISYRINVKNLARVTLQNPELEVFYPLGFDFLDATPDPPADSPDGRKFLLSEIPSGGEKTVVIVGRLDGALQEVKVISVKLHYVPANFRSTFVAEASANTQILAPDLAFRLIAPPHLVTGQKLIYEMEITNISHRPFSGLTVRINYPEKFVFAGADPPPREEGSPGEWEISELGIGESMTITTAGIVQENPGQEVFASAQLFVRSEDGQEVASGRSFAFTEIKPSPLKLSHRAANNKSTVLPDEELYYEITYQNISQVGLNNVVFVVVFETPTVDLSKFSSTGGQWQNQRIIWIPAQLPQLLVIDPGEQGKLDLRLPVSQKVLTDLQKNPTVRSRVEYYSKELPEPIAANTVELKVESTLAVLGSGVPLGGSDYRVDLEVKNGVNDAVNAILTGIAPIAGVELVLDSVAPPDEQGQVQLIPNAGLLRWDLGRVFAFTGSFHESRKLSFILRLPPGAPTGDVTFTLLRDIEISGTDEFTGNQITSKKFDRISNR